MGPLMGSRSFWKGSEIFYRPSDHPQVKLKAFNPLKIYRTPPGAPEDQGKFS